MAFTGKEPLLPLLLFHWPSRAPAHASRQEGRGREHRTLQARRRGGSETPGEQPVSFVLPLSLPFSPSGRGTERPSGWAQQPLWGQEGDRHRDRLFAGWGVVTRGPGPALPHPCPPASKVRNKQTPPKKESKASMSKTSRLLSTSTQRIQEELADVTLGSVPESWSQRRPHL